MRRKLQPFLQHMPAGSSVLDIGSGGGLATSVLREAGFQVTPMDIQDGAYDDSTRPVVYDGKTFPFPDGQFDFGLLLTVLHHIQDPDAVLAEAFRTCRTVLIVEDIYRNPAQQYLTYATDWFVNLFYSPNPHTNRNDAQWKETFQRFDKQLIAVTYKPLLGLYLQAWYVVGTQEV